MTESQPNSLTKVQIIGRFLFFSTVLVLLIAIVWSTMQTITLVTQTNEQNQVLSQRSEAYVATATALALPELQSSNDDSLQLIAQFATNTPAVEQPQVTTTPAPQGTPVPLPTFFRPSGSDLGEISGTAVPTQVPVIPRDYELINILLLGSDDELGDGQSLRTDTMIVVSINTETRSVAMLSLPRDLFVYVPTPTMQRLNTVYNIGDAFGWDGGGFGLLRQTIFYNFGIQVHYFAKVNFSGFEEIIDTLGGIEIAVDCTYQDFYPVDDFDPDRSIEENYFLRTLPVGYYTMDGFDALWYARTRKVADDFDRGRRQQLILRSILRKALDSGQLANLPNLWGQFTEVVETDVSFDLMLGLLPIALELDTSKIENYRLIRTYHTTPWQNPDGQFVQVPNYEPIRELLSDFYQPPTDNQVALAGSTIYVYNGTANENWDLVASERLRSQGFNAVAAGLAETQDFTDTMLIDNVAASKGSLIDPIVSQLNIFPANISIEPDANRIADYTVIIGENYNSCPGGVVPVEVDS